MQKSKIKIYSWYVLLLIGHIYFWPKLLDYIDLFQYSSRIVDTLRLSINIPIYIACLAFLVRFKLCFPVFFKVWVLVAITDEILMILDGFGTFGISWDIQNILYMTPLYLMAFWYSFKSKALWQNTENFRFNVNA
ncbi:hypothetical protein EMM73_19635 [Rheinheimera sediminis]|uniref:hypothetical protein n=1 Tax=Rheinheimera sp. YQF-1 TaxID=2499626 RepID=UPI000FD8B2E3|nr:hypothetical protein [Rheinheimera sp. YQF-1]RVT40517.1 hypothetical protein EMM73_19635 [Rheinheimera sp. YQF-1]